MFRVVTITVIVSYVSDEKIKELVEEIDNILSEPDPKTKLAKAEANLT